MIKSLDINIEAVVIHKNQLDKEFLDLYRRVYTTCIEKEDFYIFVNRINQLDYSIIAKIERDTLLISELYCDYNLDITFPEMTLSSLPRYKYLDSVSKFLTKENVQLKSIYVNKVRRLSLLTNDIEITNDTIMDDVKSSLYSHYKDDPSSKQPLAFIGEDIPEIIFRNISEIVTYNLAELGKVFI